MEKKKEEKTVVKWKTKKKSLFLHCPWGETFEIGTELIFKTIVQEDFSEIGKDFICTLNEFITYLGKLRIINSETS